MEEFTDYELAIGLAACKQAKYGFSPREQQEEFDRSKPYYVDIARAVIAVPRND